MTQIIIFDPLSVLTARITHLLETLGSASLEQDSKERLDKTENSEKLPAAITLNFRDPDYSPETGGFHPVEVRLQQMVSEAPYNRTESVSEAIYRIAYITDFSYVGTGWDIELAKELDFDWDHQVCEIRGTAPFPLQEAKELFRLFADNFCHYHTLDVFQMEITFEE